MGKGEIELRGWGALHRLGERRLGVLTGAWAGLEVNVHMQRVENINLDTIKNVLDFLHDFD
jgi:hypothetical protein